MGANTKALRVRIKSVGSTLHLTKAMGLVASSKVRRANDAMFKSRQFLENIESVTDLLRCCEECKRSEFMRPADERTKLIVIAGDRGLAGGYNANIFRFLRDYENAEFVPIGKKACERLKSEIISSEHFSLKDAHELAKKLCSEFSENKFGKLGIVSTRYISMMSQEPYIKWLLPLSYEKPKNISSVLFEPSEAAIFKTAVHEYVAGAIYECIKESFASEVTARRMAMDNAGKNATQMIDDLQLEYNRARQSAITQEITEIVAGSGN